MKSFFGGVHTLHIGSGGTGFSSAIDEPFLDFKTVDHEPWMLKVLHRPIMDRF